VRLIKSFISSPSKNNFDLLSIILQFCNLVRFDLPLP